MSTYRSNDRHIAKIHRANILPQQADLVDNDVQESEKNRNKVECHHKFMSRPYRSLYKIFSETHDIQISFPTFCRLKPFYITPVTMKEMETCLCVVCCNNNCEYSAIRRNVKLDLPRSLSEYLCSTITCTKNTSLNYHNIECISGTCNANCKIRNVVKDLINVVKEAYALNNRISYYVFEPVTTYYFNKQGKKSFL